MTLDLSAWQRALTQHVLHGSDEITPALRAGGIGTARRLAIYHHAYRMRLLEALRDTYGHTLRYLGDEAFDAAALAYIETHPALARSLRDYAPDFAVWLTQHLHEEPEAGEIALLDHALRRAFDGPDAEPLSLQDLAAMAAEDAEVWTRPVLQLHPNCQRLRLQHNALTLWHAMDQEQPAPPPERLAEPGAVLVWRRALQPHFRSLGAQEACALDALQAGQSWVGICGELTATFPGEDHAALAGALLRCWLDEGLLCATAPPGSTAADRARA